jgi:hypothetical protein
MNRRDTDFVTEMRAMVDSFFNNATAEEFGQLLTDIDYEYYRNLKIPVLIAQARSQTFRRDRVLLPFSTSNFEFQEIVASNELRPPADHSELALAA